jgi:hypothetical protein
MPLRGKSSKKRSGRSTKAAKKPRTVAKKPKKAARKARSTRAAPKRSKVRAGAKKSAKKSSKRTARRSPSRSKASSKQKGALVGLAEREQQSHIEESRGALGQRTTRSGTGDRSSNDPRHQVEAGEPQRAITQETGEDEDVPGAERATEGFLGERND